MRSIIRLYTLCSLVFLGTLVCSQSLAAEGPDCFTAILDKRSQDYEFCYQLIDGDKQMRGSQKKQKLDLLDRLTVVQKNHEDCEDQSINFLSQYGIKNLERPAQDMNLELTKFWELFLGHCPKLKERFQSE